MYTRPSGVDPTVITATINSGASLSAAIELKGEALIGIIIPASWTTANLTFQGSVDGTNYSNIYDDLGTEVTVQASASRHIRLIPTNWIGYTHIKLRSGTSGTPVNQAAARTITLVTRAV